VKGNSIVSQQLFVGGNSGSSNVNVNGTIGFGVQTVSSNAILGDSSVILVDSSSDNITLTLPYAGNVNGRMYFIKKNHASNHVLIGGDNLIDNSCYYRLNSGNTGGITLCSNGEQWYVMAITTGGQSVTWTPEFLATSLWLDASDNTTILAGISDNVYQWQDKSGNDLHAEQSTAALQPTTGSRALNGLNVLNFSAQSLATSFNINRPNTPDLSVFAVFAQDMTTGNFGLFGADDGGWDRLVLLNFDSNTGAEWGVSNGGGTVAFEATRTSDTADHLLTIIWSSGVINGSGVSLDGATSTVFTESVGSAGFTTTGIGSIRPTSQYPLDGYIAEMIFITSVVATEDRQKIEGYLAHKWGLQANLPAEHPYKNHAP